MASSLIIPRVEVFWGDYNLTSYSGGDVKQSDPLYQEPLVYDVSVNLSDVSQTPTGSMSWNPTGAAYRVYERLVSKFSDRIITVRYHYLGGRSISFAFVWSGQQESYGNSMAIRVSLSSELDGLINGNIVSTVQADPKEQGVSIDKTISDLEKSFGVEKYKLIDYSKKAKEDFGKTKVETSYNPGMKFYDSVSGIAETNGNTVFPSNIISTSDASVPAAKCIIFTPYAWDKDNPVEELPPTEQFPDPKVRYGYFLGPALIDTITKSSQWQPPQKRQELTLNTQQKLDLDTPETQGTQKDAVPQKGVKESGKAAKDTTGATGTSGSSSRSRTKLLENENGETKKLQLERQKQCKLSTTLFMAPVFTGLKPYDIIFIPNFSGTFMEDWIVTSVEYAQTDGGVTLSVQATRQFSLGEFMNPEQGKSWLEKAKSFGLVGEKGTLDNWVNYGWKPKKSGAGEEKFDPNVRRDAPTVARVSGFTVGVNENLA